jgi:hypothetical protein
MVITTIDWFAPSVRQGSNYEEYCYVPFEKVVQPNKAKGIYWECYGFLVLPEAILKVPE